MNTILKIISGLAISTCLFFSLITGAVLLMEGKNPIDPFIDTKFAENFTPIKFDKIELGMSKEEVVEIIGKPLWIRREDYDTLLTSFTYTGDGKLENGDFAWYGSRLQFDRGDTVIFIHKGWVYD